MTLAPGMFADESIIDYIYRNTLFFRQSEQASRSPIPFTASNVDCFQRPVFTMNRRFNGDSSFKPCVIIHLLRRNENPPA
jgi:hypothetical protein